MAGCYFFKQQVFGQRLRRRPWSGFCKGEPGAAYIGWPGHGSIPEGGESLPVGRGGGP